MEFRFWKKTEKRNTELTDYFSNALLFNGLRNTNTAMSISAVYRSVEIISDAIAMLPLELKKKEAEHYNKVTNHPIITALKENELMSKYTLIKLMVQSVLLKGNAFCLIQRGTDNIVTNLKYIEAQDVTIHYDARKNELYYTVPTISNRRIEPCSMIHLLKNSYNGVEGISVLSYANRSVTTANATENSASNFFQNNRNLSGILSVDGNVNSEKSEQIRSAWNTAYSSGGSGIAVIPSNIHYQPIQVSASDAQLIESRQFNVKDIARFFSVPVSMLTGEGTQTVEQQQQALLLHCLMPYITMIEEELNRKLLTPTEKKKYKITLEENYLIKIDKAGEATYYNTMLSNGVLCINEVRNELELAPVLGGDKHLIAYSNVEKNNITNTDTEDDTYKQG